MRAKLAFALAMGLTVVQAGLSRAAFTVSMDPSTKTVLASDPRTFFVDVKINSEDGDDLFQFGFQLGINNQDGNLKFQNFVAGDPDPLQDPNYVFAAGSRDRDGDGTHLPGPLGTASADGFTFSGGDHRTAGDPALDSTKTYVLLRLKFLAGTPTATTNYVVSFALNNPANFLRTQPGEGSPGYNPAFTGVTTTITLQAGTQPNPVPAPASLILALAAVPFAGAGGWRRLRRPAAAV